MQRQQIEDLIEWWRSRADESLCTLKHVTPGKAYETAEALEQLLKDTE